MPVFNRRNAAVGWLALFFGKRVAEAQGEAGAAGQRRGLQAAQEEGRRAADWRAPSGLATFWRRRSDDEETGPQS